MNNLGIKLLLEKILRIENSKEWEVYIKESEVGNRYYENDSDIKRVSAKVRNNSVLRVADNRDSYNWHGLFVDQKAGYMFGREPIIDVGEPALNKEIINALGDEWGKTLNDLVRKASNSGITWLHYWIDKEKKFQYGIVPDGQVIPIYSDDLKQRLNGVARKYNSYNSDGKKITIYELWDDKQCQFMIKNKGNLIPYNTIGNNETNIFHHTLGKVPFIYFNNNSIKKYDLYMYKDLIDQFEKVSNGFANDIEDVQEIIFVLKGYGGEELQEFMEDLKVFKAVKTEDNGDLKTIKAEIPIEARDKFLESMKKAIFLFGMGVNPDKDSLGDSSGVALKFLYSLLELKASKTRIEFDCSIKVLIRAILNFLGKNEGQDISVTYFKNMVTNDKEIVEIISKSGASISNETKTKNHPYTENLDEELDRIKSEEADEDYNEHFGMIPGGADRDE